MGWSWKLKKSVYLSVFCLSWWWKVKSFPPVTLLQTTWTKISNRQLFAQNTFVFSWFLFMTCWSLVTKHTPPPDGGAVWVMKIELHVQQRAEKTVRLITCKYFLLLAFHPPLPLSLPLSYSEVALEIRSPYFNSEPELASLWSEMICFVSLF